MKDVHNTFTIKNRNRNFIFNFAKNL